MSLVNLSHTCSHLQNASLARLGLTSIPYTRLHLSLALLLQKQGFLSQVKLGGPSPPASCFPSSSQPDSHHITAHPLTPEQRQKPDVHEQYRDPWGLEEEGVVTQANRASRRLWLGLKYWDGLPVLRKAKMLSKPTKRIWLDAQELGRVVRGGQAGEIRGMTNVGEVMAVSTDRGILEARECVERKVGGMVLCRVW